VAVFAYRGLTPDGRAVRGVVDADSARGARARLRRDGVFPTELREERPTASGAGGGLVRRWSGRVRTTDLAVLSRQLGTLTGAGVPVVEALGAVGEQSERPAVSRVLSHVRDRVTQGSSLADALAEHRRIVREACAAESGVEVDTQGDAFFFAFQSQTFDTDEHGNPLKPARKGGVVEPLATRKTSFKRSRKAKSAKAAG